MISWTRWLGLRMPLLQDFVEYYLSYSNHHSISFTHKYIHIHLLTCNANTEWPQNRIILKKPLLFHCLLSHPHISSHSFISHLQYLHFSHSLYTHSSFTIIHGFIASLCLRSTLFKQRIRASLSSLPFSFPDSSTTSRQMFLRFHPVWNSVFTFEFWLLWHLNIGPFSISLTHSTSLIGHSQLN